MCLCLSACVHVCYCTVLLRESVCVCAVVCVLLYCYSLLLHCNYLLRLRVQQKSVTLCSYLLLDCDYLLWLRAGQQCYCG